MSKINYKVVKQRSTKSGTEQYVPVWNMHDTMSYNELVEEIANAMGISYGTVSGIITEVKSRIQRQLHLGHAVEIDGFGLFKLDMTVTAWPTEDVPVECIKSVQVRFYPKRDYCKRVLNDE